MRRLMTVLVCVLILVGLCPTAHAATGMSSMKTQATISGDGTGQVTAQLTIHLDEPVEKLYFPIPEEASAVAVNGSRVLTQRKNDVRSIDLSRLLGGMSGDFTVTVSYRIADLVARNDAGLLQLTLPLLNGFAYPVRSFELTVMMPGPINVKPGFISGYHQANIEKDLVFHTEGATITCRSQGALKDHETLQMVLSVSEEMFPQSVIQAPQLAFSNTAALICGILAVLYWLLCLRFRIPLWRTQTTAPEGFTAGELTGILHLAGADLSYMALTWAQQGYLLIRQSPAGGVTLVKQMEMGNEHSLFQRKCFHALFSKKPVVDTRSGFYVQQYQKVAAMQPNIQAFVTKGSGNRKIFRGLTSLCGMFLGVSLGSVLGAEAAAWWLVIVLMGAFGLFSTRFCMKWAFGLILPNPTRLWGSLGLMVLWLALGFACGQAVLSAWAVAMLLVFGLLYAFGGRRTPEGRQAFAQVMGLRRYLRRADKQDIRRICQTNPEYFYDFAPYALALGVCRSFADRFDKQHTPCPYIADSRELSLTPRQWSDYMLRLYKQMNLRVRRQWLERLYKRVIALRPQR